MRSCASVFMAIVVAPSILISIILVMVLQPAPPYPTTTIFELSWESTSSSSSSTLLLGTARPALVLQDKSPLFKASPMMLSTLILLKKSCSYLTFSLYLKISKQLASLLAYVQTLYDNIYGLFLCPSAKDLPEEYLSSRSCWNPV